MIGLYLLTTEQLIKEKTIKFGMSMRLEYRWIDYLSIFSDSKYVYYYEFLDKLTREDILDIEDEILQLHKNERNNFFQTEYFYCNDNKQFHQSIIDVLASKKINYKVHDKHDFDRKYYDNKPDTFEPNIKPKETNEIIIPREHQINVLFKKYFLSNEDEWLNNIDNLKKYIDNNNKTPSQNDKIDEIKKLSNWMYCQITIYKNKKNIMKNSEIYNKWIEFITSEKYKKYFLSNEDEWLNNLDNVKKYIDENDKRPSTNNKKIEIQILGKWIIRQNTIYKLKEQIMKNPEIYNKWTEIIISEKYKKYFMSYEDEWLNNLDMIKKYIDTNNKRPSSSDKNKEIKILSKWISHQITNYKSKGKIMKNHLEIYNQWTKFINDPIYNKYFLKD